MRWNREGGHTNTKIWLTENTAGFPVPERPWGQTLSPERVYPWSGGVRCWSADSFSFKSLIESNLAAFLSSVIAKMARACNVFSILTQTRQLPPTSSGTMVEMPHPSLGRQTKRVSWENKGTVAAAMAFQPHQEWGWYLGPLWAKNYWATILYGFLPFLPPFGLKSKGTFK